jgi:hypothetical protein
VFGVIRILVIFRPCPEGRCVRSLARDAWKTATPKRPSRRVRREGISQEEAIHDDENHHGLAAPDHTVPYGTVLSRGNIPGTSCQATIGLSLRDSMCCLARMSPDWVQQAIALLLQIFYDGAKIDRLIREPSILGNLGLI